MTTFKDLYGVGEENPLVALLGRVHSERMCTELFCTTCGALKLRSELKNIAGKDGMNLKNCLLMLQPSSFRQLPQWENALIWAFRILPQNEQKNEVLQAWVEDLDKNVRVADYLLFYVVRDMDWHESEQPTSATRWLNKCVEIAVKSHDNSLVESLIWTLKGEIVDYPELYSVVQGMSDFPLISKALRQVVFLNEN